jgi:biopolymer transport protein ExbB
MRRNTDTHKRRLAKNPTGIRFVAGFALAVLVAMLALPTSAQAWWNEEWSMRKKITLDTSSTGSAITDPIGNLPVLVRLHVGNFRFAGAKDDGTDLRFVSGDDKTPLKFHIEKYDPMLGEALVWVSVPNLQPGAKADVWLYYGNKKANAASDPKGTYGSDTSLVYHFTERGAPAQDSTVWLNSAQNAGQAADGSLIGTGLRLDGVATLTIPATPSLAFAQDSQLTLSAWIKPSALQRNAVLYARREGSNGLVIGLDDGRAAGTMWRWSQHLGSSLCISTAHSIPRSPPRFLLSILRL